MNSHGDNPLNGPRKSERHHLGNIYFDKSGNLDKKKYLDKELTKKKPSKCFLTPGSIVVAGVFHVCFQKKTPPCQTNKNSISSSIFGTWTCWICHWTPWTFRPRIGCQLWMQVPPDIARGEIEMLVKNTLEETPGNL